MKFPTRMRSVHENISEILHEGLYNIFDIYSVFEHIQ